MLAYDTDVLRSGAAVAAQVSSTVSGSGTTLSSATVIGDAFGQVGKAAGLAATLAEVHRRQTQHATTMAANADVSGVRLRTAAGFGDQLSVDTTTVASGLQVRVA